MTATWEGRAVCRGMDVDEFFEPFVTRTAKAACALCPVQRECLDAAMAEEGNEVQVFGYRGGRTPKQRKALRRRRAEGAA